MYRVRSSDALMQEVGQGDAYVFRDRDFSPLRAMFAQNKELEQRAEQAKQKRDYELDQQRKYNQKAIFAPFQREHSLNGKKLLELRTQAFGKDIGSPEDKAFNEHVLKLEQNVAKGNDVEKSYFDAMKKAEENPFLNHSQVYSQINDGLYGNDGQSRLSVEDTNPSNFYNPLNDPKNFNGGYAVKKFSDSLPEFANSYIQRIKEAEGDRFNETSIKSKFYKYDNNGRLQVDPKTNQPIINVTPETKQAFFDLDPLVKPWVDLELQKPENKGLTEDQFLQKKLSPYAFEQRNKNVGSLERPRAGSGDDDVKVSVSHDVSRNTMSKLLGDGNEKGVKEGYLPTVITLSGSKMDKPVRYNLKEYVDETTGNLVKEQIGDKEIHFTEIQKRPYNKKTGKFLQGSKEDLDANPEVGYKWVASGRLKKSDDQEPTPIFVELSDVKDKINKAYKIDLDKYTETKDSLELNKKDDPLGIR